MTIHKSILWNDIFGLRNYQNSAFQNIILYFAFAKTCRGQHIEIHKTPNKSSWNSWKQRSPTIMGILLLEWRWYTHWVGSTRAKSSSRDPTLIEPRVRHLFLLMRAPFPFMWVFFLLVRASFSLEFFRMYAGSLSWVPANPWPG